MSNLIGRAAVDIPADENDFPEEPSLSKGIHQAMVVEITEGVNEDTKEQWAKVVLELIGGPHHGQKVADWWGWGGNEVREQISNKKFKTLLTLCGVTDTLNDYSQLYMTHIGINNKPYQANDGTMRNSFNYYKRGTNPLPQQAAPMAAPTPHQAPPAQPRPQAPVPQAPIPQQAPPPPPAAAAPPPPPQQHAAPPPAPNGAPPAASHGYIPDDPHWGETGEPPF